MAEKVEIEVITSKLEEKFDRLMFTDRNFRNQVIKTMKKYIQKARNETSRDLKDIVGDDMEHSHGDPRQAYKAVKFSIWKNALGGSVSIYNKRKAGNTRVNLRRDRKLDHNPHQRGGNRVKRDESTKASKLDTYFGSDRSFILRWLDQGTIPDRSSKYGNRAGIAGRRFFYRIARYNLKKSAEQIEKEICEAIKKIWNK